MITKGKHRAFQLT